MNNYPDRDNEYRRENKAFIKLVKTALDEFSSKLTRALQEITNYRDNKPFIRIE